ncbi:MAG: 2-succinyl-5-enolpyruvyl-6-hydroxy-3-cyclohexene-1-carboxylic-acid synthase [Thainema sp.]
MAIDFRNTNSVWASIVVETLAQLGLKTAVLCPGSRSTPLTVAFAQHPGIESIPILDERSAAFFALGRARQSHNPVVVVCTSGTAGANFYSAVIEARESNIPLLILTADRPPELRDCNAGQTIDQQKLYGSYSNWYHEVALPSLEFSRLTYLRQTIVQAWKRAGSVNSGAVHLNFPFRDPLAPVPEEAAIALAAEFPISTFFAHLNSTVTAQLLAPLYASPTNPTGLLNLFDQWQMCDRGLIIAGIAQPTDPEAYCCAIAQLSQILNWPILAEGLSPVRNYASLNPHLVSTYDLILRSSEQAEQLQPQQVIRIGEMPTSKILRQWLTQVQPLQWVIDPRDRNLDPLHGQTAKLSIAIEALMQWWTSCTANVTGVDTDLAISNARSTTVTTGDASKLISTSQQSERAATYLQQWQQAERQQRHYIDTTLTQTDEWLESKLIWQLAQVLPTNTPLFIANSMPVRDVEWFWPPSDRNIQPYFNRGANGIDGTLSTALGIAHHQRPSVLLTGDLAFLHDTNGLLIRPKFHGHLTIVMINNHGGGIFEMLPIAQFDPPFEEFFATPQSVELEPLCQAYGVEYRSLQTWDDIKQHLSQLPKSGIRLLEFKCDRKTNQQWRRSIFSFSA